MAKLYNIQTLRKIHATKTASNGVIYQTQDSKVDGGTRYYVGNSNGRLDEVTDITLIEETNNNVTVNEVDITALEADIARLEADKSSKCFTLAMAIALG